MICSICKTEFDRRVHNQKMCSDVCVRVYRSAWMRNSNAARRATISPKEKTCQVCSSVFHVLNDKGRPKTCSLACKAKLYSSRVSHWQRLRKYGLSPRAFQEMLDVQNGACAICGKPHTECSTGLYVDHDHATGVVRQLLCQGCNTGIGSFRDDPDLLRKAAAYLEAHARKTPIKVAQGG